MLSYLCNVTRNYMNIERLVTGWTVNKTPTNYGIYHLCCLAVMVVIIVLLCKFLASKKNKDTDDKVVFAFGALLVIIETYKQIFYTLDAGHYQWYAFPFQFCSVPMYVMFVAPLFNEGRIKNAMYSFLATYGLIAGISVMLYPDSCFSTHYVTILIHTMVWHMSMVIVGIYLIVARGIGRSYKKDVLSGLWVFLTIVVIALVANILGYQLYFKNPELNIYNEKLFLLYISPYYDSPLPILSNIKEATPYPIFLMAYIAAFLLGVSAVYGIVKFIRFLKETPLRKKNA